MIIHSKDSFGWKKLWYIARTLGCIRDELSIRDGMKTYSYSLVYKGSKYQKYSLSMWEKCDKTFSGKTPLKKNMNHSKLMKSCIFAQNVTRHSHKEAV